MPTLPGNITYSLEQVLELLYNAGFRGLGLVHAAAVTFAESQGNSGAYHSNRDGSTDWGLFQFNDRQPPIAITKDCALDPNCAVQKFYQASSGGQNLNPWCTFPGSPCYDPTSQFTAVLPQVQHAVAQKYGAVPDTPASSGLGPLASGASPTGGIAAPGGGSLGPGGNAGTVGASDTHGPQDCWFTLHLPTGSVCVPNPLSGVGNALSGAESSLVGKLWSKELPQRSLALLLGVMLIPIGLFLMFREQAKQAVTVIGKTAGAAAEAGA